MALNLTLLTTDKIDFGSPSGLDDVEPITIAMWCKVATHSKNSTARLFSKAQYSAEIRHNAGNTWGILFFRVYSTTNGLANSPDDTIVPDTWQFFAFTMPAPGSSPRIFAGDLNTLVAEVPSYKTQTDPVGTLTSDASSSLIYGNRSGQVDATPGDHAWFGIYDSVLTLGQLQALQFATAKQTSSCILNTHFGFNGTGTQQDWSGKSHTATTTGAVVADHVPIGPQYGYDFMPAFAVIAAVGRVGNIIGRGGLVGPSGAIIG